MQVAIIHRDGLLWVIGRHAIFNSQALQLFYQTLLKIWEWPVDEAT